MVGVALAHLLYSRFHLVGKSDLGSNPTVNRIWVKMVISGDIPILATGYPALPACANSKLLHLRPRPSHCNQRIQWLSDSNQERSM